MALYRRFDDTGLGVTEIVADHRQAMERAEHERAAVRLRALEAQSSAGNDPQVHLIQRQVSLCCDHFDERVLWRPRQ